ncbi:hypothetical protein AAZX31_17G188800 [Glycine max]
MADPNDGGILMQYAKLVWENHHDKDRKMVYFECAVQPTPQDSLPECPHVSVSQFFERAKVHSLGFGRCCGMPHCLP